MIRVRSDVAGSLTIDFSGEPSFNIDTNAVDLQVGLFVKRVLSAALIVDDTGRPGVIVDYIKSSLEPLGYQVEVESGLQSLIESVSVEENLAEQARVGEVGQSQFTETPNLKKLIIQRPMLPHQLTGMNHALRVCNAANFSVPGSGKTATTLCTYAVLLEEGTVDLLLIIGPASSFDPWEKEFNDTFGRKPNSVRLVGHAQTRSRLLENLSDVDVVLCTYQMAYRERDNLQALLTKRKVLLILDESHYIKNINLGPWAQTTLDLAPLAKRRIILTGTPMPHSLRDLWSQFTFLWPSEAVLRDRSNYEQRAQSPNNTLEEVREEIRPFFHRTKRSELGLPQAEVNYVPILPDQVPKQQRLIVRLLELKVLNEARAIGLGNADISTLKRWRRARMIRLMQAASNPSLLSFSAMGVSGLDIDLEGEPRLAPLVAQYAKKEVPAKVAWTIEKARNLVSTGKKVVIWAHFVRNLELLKEQLGDLDPLMIHGGVPAYDDEEAESDFENRESNIREFKEKSDRPVLLANPGACSESISLHTVCQDAIYFERTFNCGQFLQSMDRINRVGMPLGTHARYFIPLMPFGIERVIQKRLTERATALHMLLEDDLPILGTDDEEDFDDSTDDLNQLFADVLKEIEHDVMKDERHP